jgi:N-acetylglucosamine-6-phosphate deacetylase
MATQTPAEILGIHAKGRIVAGADADLVLLEPSGAVYETIVGGETVYAVSREEDRLPGSPRG